MSRTAIHQKGHQQNWPLKQRSSPISMNFSSCRKCYMVTRSANFWFIYWFCFCFCFFSLPISLLSVLFLHQNCHSVKQIDLIERSISVRSKWYFVFTFKLRFLTIEPISNHLYRSWFDSLSPTLSINHLTSSIGHFSNGISWYNSTRLDTQSLTSDLSFIFWLIEFFWGTFPRSKFSFRLIQIDCYLINFVDCCHYCVRLFITRLSPTDFQKMERKREKSMCYHSSRHSYSVYCHRINFAL